MMPIRYIGSRVVNTSGHDRRPGRGDLPTVLSFDRKKA